MKNKPSCFFQTIDAGELKNARYTEPFAVLTVSMVGRLGWDPKEMELSLAGQRAHSGM